MCLFSQSPTTDVCVCVCVYFSLYNYGSYIQLFRFYCFNHNCYNFITTLKKADMKILFLTTEIWLYIHLELSHANYMCVCVCVYVCVRVYVCVFS